MPRTVSKLPGKHIDAWINRMDEGTTEKDRDKTLHAIAAQIEALIPANASPKILLLNTHTSTAAEELTEGLKALNPNRFIGAGTLLDDPETVKLTKETGTVILLETRGKSRYSIFAQELNLLNVMDVKILGTILL